MKIKIKVIFLFSLVILISFFYVESLLQFIVNIVGYWVLNINEMIDNFKVLDMIKEEVVKFLGILKFQELVILEVVYLVLRFGQKLMNIVYIIEFDVDSEGCFILQFRDLRILLDVQRYLFCVREVKLLLFLLKDVYEVYNRKQQWCFVSFVFRFNDIKELIVVKFDYENYMIVELFDCREQIDK